MLITFKSKAAGDIHMFAEHAQQVLEIIGKSLDPREAPRGIITADQVPGALAQLKAAADGAKAAQKGAAQGDEEPGTPISVSLAQRAYPLIDMLERAAQKKVEIVWGV